MPVKDHYRVLSVAPSASAEEIKKAFRKLALLHHPDKANGNIASIERFAEIQEAYAVLSDRKKRSDYHYSRYRETSIHKPLPETAGDLLASALSLQKRISQFDPFRIDRDLVYFEIKDLLTTRNRQILQSANDETAVTAFTFTIMACMAPLSFDRVKELCFLLDDLYMPGTQHRQAIKDFLKSSYRLHWWNSYKVYFALLISVLLCLCIFFLTRS